MVNVVAVSNELIYWAAKLVAMTGRHWHCLDIGTVGQEPALLL